MATRPENDAPDGTRAAADDNHDMAPASQHVARRVGFDRSSQFHTARPCSRFDMNWLRLRFKGGVNCVHKNDHRRKGSVTGSWISFQPAIVARLRRSFVTTLPRAQECRLVTTFTFLYKLDSVPRTRRRGASTSPMRRARANSMRAPPLLVKPIRFNSPDLTPLEEQRRLSARGRTT